MKTSVGSCRFVLLGRESVLQVAYRRDFEHELQVVGSQQFLQASNRYNRYRLPISSVFGTFSLLRKTCRVLTALRLRSVNTSLLPLHSRHAWELFKQMKTESCCGVEIGMFTNGHVKSQGLHLFKHPLGNDSLANLPSSLPSAQFAYLGS